MTCDYFFQSCKCENNGSAYVYCNCLVNSLFECEGDCVDGEGRGWIGSRICGVRQTGLLSNKRLSRAVIFKTIITTCINSYKF